jgi:hypothetical protein
MHLKSGEEVTKCWNRTSETGEQKCAECGQECYRIIVIAEIGSEPRKLLLCGRHFMEALYKYPHLENTSDNRGMLNRVAFVSA